MTETAAAPPTLNTDIPEAAIDTSSTLSPNSPHPALEARLNRRPDPKDLVNRNILHDPNTSPSLQKQKEELQHAITVDSLKKGLAHRPTREELEDRGILPNEKIAPALLVKKAELEKSMKTDTLNTMLQKRPKPEEVIDKGILNADEDPRSPQ